MRSGNFLIGKYGLTLEGFLKYIEPQIHSRECEVTDRLSVLYDRNKQKGNVLISIAGEGELVGILGESLRAATICAGEEVDRLEKERSSTEPVAYPHHIDFYEVLGLYGERETASKIFPLLAFDYLGKNAEQNIALLETRLRELLNQNIGSLLR